MQSREILGFRDPQARLRDIILMQGYENQIDQPLYDRVDSYTREVALDVLQVLEVYIDRGYPIENDELQELILSPDWQDPVIESPRVLH